MKHLRKIINLNYLTTLTTGNNHIITDMIKLFITEITKEIQLIEKGIIENDFTLIKSRIHNIKGIMYYVGLDKIVKKDLLEIEKLAVNQLDILGIGMLFSKTKKKFRRAIQELNDWILLTNVKKTCK
ncbi:MAG: Hpt domain-containing protein [Bacteroidetes bacterium]|nr:Hpt domain-containing protein [Bacteroidota bacterium]